SAALCTLFYCLNSISRSGGRPPSSPEASRVVDRLVPLADRPVVYDAVQHEGIGLGELLGGLARAKDPHRAAAIGERPYQQQPPRRLKRAPPLAVGGEVLASLFGHAVLRLVEQHVLHGTSRRAGLQRAGDPTSK